MKLWAVFINEFKIFARDRGSAVQFFLIPILVITLASFAMKDIYGGTGAFRLPWVDEDQSRVSREVVEEVKKIGLFTVEEIWKDGNKVVPMTAELAQRLIAGNHSRTVAVVIPRGFEANLVAQKPVEIVVYENPLERIAPLMAKSVMDLVASRLSGASITVALASQETGQAVTPGLFRRILQDVQAQWASPPVFVSMQDLVNPVGKKMDSLKQNVPGFAVMFALFSLVWGCMSIINERERGTLSRLLSAPISKAEILAGKLLMTFCITCFQLVTFFAFGHFIFGMDLGNSLTGLALMSVAVALTTTSLGILIAALAKTPGQIGGYSSILIMGMSALGGSWWPTEFMPEYMQKLGHLLTINAWAMDGYKDILWYGRGVSAIWPEMGVLLGFAALAFTIGVWKLKLE